MIIIDRNRHLERGQLHKLILNNRLKTIAVNMTVNGVIICDMRKPDQPIIFANESFLELTGYLEEEVINRNCRFLQGEGTDLETVQEIRETIKRQQSGVFDILNYTKEGQPFWSELRLNPVFNTSGILIYYVGFQFDATPRKEVELKLKKYYEHQKHEMQMAQLLQQGLLPQEMDHPSIKLRSIYKPADYISGDFCGYQWIQRNHKSILFGYIGDVMGHGLTAALQTSSIRLLFEQAAAKELSLAEKVSFINRSCADYLPEDYFVAAFCFEVHLDQPKLVYVPAGIYRFLHYSLANKDPFISAPGPLLGMMADSQFEEFTLPLLSGDEFYFMTDGIYEHVTNISTLSNLNFEQRMDQLLRMASESSSKDDATAICLQYK